VLYSPLTIADVAKAAGPLLAGQDAPTAIITNSDYTAHAIYKTARALSLRIGPGVSVIGHDDLPTSDLLDPPLATVRVDGRQMGRVLMARLLGTDGGADYRAPVELAERASLAAPENRCSCGVHVPAGGAGS
jgi:LacI family transcriptional regulator